MRGLRPSIPGLDSSGAVDQGESSALKMRRNKKNLTAAQSQGKVTGRWTDEEHERF